MLEDKSIDDKNGDSMNISPPIDSKWLLLKSENKIWKTSRFVETKLKIGYLGQPHWIIAIICQVTENVMLTNMFQTFESF